MKVKQLETCACCGYQSIPSKGNYDICPICYWEDDNVLEADPWFDGGANKLSLFESQINFKLYGAMEERFKEHVRKPEAKDIKNPKWRELEESDKEFATTPVEIEKAWGTSNCISYNYWERNPQKPL